VLCIISPKDGFHSVSPNFIYILHPTPMTGETNMKHIIYLILTIIMMTSVLAQLDMWAGYSVNGSTIQGNIFSNVTLDEIEYAIDDEWQLACNDCDNYAFEEVDTPGAHILGIRGSLETEDDNLTYNDTYDFYIKEIGLAILSPEQEVDENVTLEFETQREADIRYILDGDESVACEDCTHFEEELELDVGEHNLQVIAEIVGYDETVEIDFEVIGEIGLRIINPEAAEYDENVTLHFTTELESDIQYILDDEEFDACEDCTEFEEELELTEGEHTLEVIATVDDREERIELDFDVLGDIGLQIVSPEEEEYDETVTLEFTTERTADVSYVLDGDEFLACDDCTEFEEEVELDEGEHTLEVIATTDDDEERVELEFEVILDELRVVIGSPDEEQDETVTLEFWTNQDADVTYTLDDEDFAACEDCSYFTKTVTLEEGEHELLVRAENDDGTDTESIDFTVTLDEEEEEEDDEHRYMEGFNKLPQMLENGEIDDEELADILRNNRVPPGVINRLIKTRLLEEESLYAILEYQMSPPGIFKKFWGWFGWRATSHSELVYDRYDLSEKNEQKILRCSDFPEDKKEKVKESLQKKFKTRVNKSLVGKSFTAGSEVHSDKKASKDKKVPPGQAKKVGKQKTESGKTGQVKKSVDSGKKKGSGKIPPGQAKKGNSKGKWR